MKHLALFIIFFSTSFNGFSQNYIPLPDSAARWTNEYSLVEPFPVNHCEFYDANYYCVNGEDTLINTTYYIKLKFCNNGDYQGAIRNDSGIVFFVPKDSIGEFILYDFTAQVGDTIPNVYWRGFGGAGVPAYLDSAIFTQEDSILIQGNYRKLMYIDFLEPTSGSVNWIEGIGNTHGFLLGSADNVSGFCLGLSCFSYKDSTLYPQESNQPCALDLSFEETEFENKISVYPNPTKNGTITIQHQEENLNYTIINSRGQEIKRGQLLDDQLSIADIPGIYFLFLYNDQGQVVRKIVVE